MSATSTYESMCGAEIEAAESTESAVRLENFYARLTVDALTDKAPMATVRMWARLSRLAKKRGNSLLRKCEDERATERQNGGAS